MYFSYQVYQILNKEIFQTYIGPFNKLEEVEINI